jgi:hypothetical protein
VSAILSILRNLSRGAAYAGRAALMLQRTPGLSPAALLSALQLGATDIESPGRDTIAGAGLVNALLSVSLVSPTTTSTSIVAVTSSTTSLPQTTSSSVPSGTTTSTTLGNLSCTVRVPMTETNALREMRDGNRLPLCTIDHAEGVSACFMTCIARASATVERYRWEWRRSSAASPYSSNAHARSIGAPPKRYLAHVRQTLNLLHQLVRRSIVQQLLAASKVVCKTRIVAALARAVSLAESTVF